MPGSTDNATANGGAGTAAKHARENPIDARLQAMLTESSENLPLERVYKWEKETPNRVFLTQPLGGVVRDWTWAQAMDEVRRVAAFINAQHWPPGSRIIILSKNCAHWMMAELAIWMSGHVSVPIYPSLTAQSVRSLLAHCEPVACFIGAIEDRTVARDGIPAGTMCIRFPTAPDCNGTDWESIVASTPPLSTNPVRPGEDLATIIYTSGTTGTPKGVMHRFAAFAHFVLGGARVFGDVENQRMLSYLPLAHIAERALVEASALFLSFHIFFVESVDTFREDLKRARPTIFFSVPRLFLKFQQGVLAKMPQEKLDRLLKIPILNMIVKHKILKELGLDAARVAASGGAPLPVETLKWFRSIGLNLIEGYGMTETGITHTPEGSRCKPGYVGNAVPGVETRIADNGEVLVRSPMNMLGYYKSPELTEQAFTPDGFFHTGDLGELDAEGWLKIVGRVKEQFKTSKGKYVSPAPIEKLLSVHPMVEACCVMGANLPTAFAIVLLTPEARQQLGERSSRARIAAEMAELLDSVNSHIDHHEQLSFLVITDEPWTVSNGFITPTLKLKRNVLEDYYARHITAWNSNPTRVVWHTVTTAVS